MGRETSLAWPPSKTSADAGYLIPENLLFPCAACGESVVNEEALAAGGMGSARWKRCGEREGMHLPRRCTRALIRHASNKLRIASKWPLWKPVVRETGCTAVVPENAKCD